MPKGLTDAGVMRLKPKAARYTVPDPELRGHYVRVAPSGAKSFVTVARDPLGRQIWTTIGTTDVLAIDAARELAREAIRRVRAGLPAVEPPKETLQAVAASYIKRHVVSNGLRTKAEIERVLNVYILPRLGQREFTGLRRSDVAALLDEIQDNHGPRQADVCLSIMRGVCNWFAARNDDYVIPLARGMGRDQSSRRARILDDDELRAVWRAAEANGTYGALVRLLLLTGQRREKVASMRWADLVMDGTWHIPTEEREKSAGGVLMLPDAALAILKGMPRFAGNPHVFAGKATGPARGFAARKAQFDAKCGVTGWTLHDLRRTAKSLMARAGVRPDISERVLGHVIGGIEGIYDRHSYNDEKADALRRLASLVESIVNPPSGNVVALREAAL